MLSPIEEGRLDLGGVGEGFTQITKWQADANKDTI